MARTPKAKKPTQDELNAAADLSEAKGKLASLEELLADTELGEDARAEVERDIEEVRELLAGLDALGQPPEAPVDDWKPQKAGQCRYCYMMASGEKRRPLAKIVKVHRGADAGLIDLEVDIPERPRAANPVLFERVPLYVAPSVPHGGTPPSYARP